jgi:hypothetical protein
VLRRRRAVIVSVLKFRSGLTDEEVQDLYEARADGYRAVPGLVEKFYLGSDRASTVPSTFGKTRRRWRRSVRAISEAASALHMSSKASPRPTSLT